MHRRRVLLGALAILGASACASERETVPVTSPPGLMDRLRGFRQNQGSDYLQMEVALLRVPIDDAFVNESLWQSVDEQIVPLEHRPILRANGFRVGILSGGVPAGLQTLMTKPESCVGARRLSVRLGSPLFFPLGSGDRSRIIRVAYNGETEEHEFDQAQLGLSLKPFVNEEGRTVLRFEPTLQHGAVQLLPKPLPDRSGWSWQGGREEVKYSHLGWEVSLEPNELLIMSGLAAESGSLGSHAFVNAGADRTQALLIVRTARTRLDTLSTATPADPREPRPLAAQTLWFKGPAPQHP